MGRSVWDRFGQQLWEWSRMFGWRRLGWPMGFPASCRRFSRCVRDGSRRSFVPQAGSGPSASARRRGHRSASRCEPTSERRFGHSRMPPRRPPPRRPSPGASRSCRCLRLVVVGRWSVVGRSSVIARSSVGRRPVVFASSACSCSPCAAVLVEPRCPASRPPPSPLPSMVSFARVRLSDVASGNGTEQMCSTSGARNGLGGACPSRADHPLALSALRVCTRRFSHPPGGRRGCAGQGRGHVCQRRASLVGRASGPQPHLFEPPRPRSLAVSGRVSRAGSGRRLRVARVAPRAPHRASGRLHQHLVVVCFGRIWGLSTESASSSGGHGQGERQDEAHAHTHLSDLGDGAGAPSLGAGCAESAPPQKTETNYGSSSKPERRRTR